MRFERAEKMLEEMKPFSPDEEHFIASASELFAEASSKFLKVVVIRHRRPEVNQYRRWYLDIADYPCKGFIPFDWPSEAIAILIKRRREDR